MTNTLSALFLTPLTRLSWGVFLCLIPGQKKQLNLTQVLSYGTGHLATEIMTKIADESKMPCNDAIYIKSTYHGQAGSRVCAPEIHLREETQKILQAHPVPKHYSRSTPVWLYPGKALSGSETGIRHFTSDIQD